MEQSQVYTYEFFTCQEGPTAHLAANTMVPIVLDLVHPRSVVDVGCGTGEFLRVFAEHAVTDLLGIDGSYIERRLLTISSEQFLPLDISQPITLSRTFDLALCLEVGEHLAAESAETLVASLVHLAPIILFSAAIPRQGGDHHVNEQWPSYWANLFAKHGYVTVDALRKRIWDDRRIAVWYRQNSLFFCTEEALSQHPQLARARDETALGMLSLVHPELYLFGYKTPGTSRISRLRRWASKSPLLRAPYQLVKSIKGRGSRGQFASEQMW